MALPEPTERRLAAAETEYDEAARRLTDAATAGRADEMKRLGQMLARLEPAVTTWRSWRRLAAQRRDLERTAEGDDTDLAGLAREELAGLAPRERELETRLKGLDAAAMRAPEDARGSILEIHAGTGGEEAALFAADLMRMYLRFAERRGWACETVEWSPTELGGCRDAVLSVDGPEAFRWLKHEGGVHRVQRVPATEAAGRIHTSAVAVVALPQADEVEVQLRPEDLRIDTYCSSGAGGQSVNTTYSAVRIVHVPTGLVAQCQDERSQHKNKERALKVLAARLAAARQGEADAKRGEARRAQVRTGDRSEKVRTYNFPQNRVTDHRVGVTVHRLRAVLDGDLDELLEALDRGAPADGG